MKKIVLFFFTGLITLSVYSQQEVVLVNKGILYVGGESSSTAKPALYIDGGYKAMDNKSSLHQKGKTVLTGNFYNKSANHVFASGHNGYFEFRGDKVQRIINIDNSKEKYIDFPNLIVNNKTQVTNEATDTAAVIIPPNVGINTLDIRVERGRLILDSDVVDANNSRMAHLLVKGDTYYPADNRNRKKHERGLIQVKLAVGNDYNYNSTGKSGSLFAFTPPFKKIYADYLFYNFLTRPTNKGLFGDKGQLITSPKASLEGGKGYIVGRGIVPENHELYTTLWDNQWQNAQYTDRVTDMMAFGRDFAPESFTQYVTSADAFTGEMLNTEDVEVELTAGWNYVGNPFTVPIDMLSFLEGASNRQNPWGVSRGNNTSYDIENKFYILSQGTGTYSPDDVYSPFNYTVTYLLAQEVGGTVNIDGTQTNGLLAPLQVFVVRKFGSSPVTMKIPASMRTHGNASFTRSATSYVVDNELLIETKDLKSGGFDRMCVVFRPDATLNATDKYDAEKILNGSGRINQIYTRSADQKNLVTTVIPFTTDKLTLYLKPANEKQEIELSAYRLKSLTGISNVKLEDTKTGKVTDLLSTPTYRFTSYPTDRADRFVLRFASTVGIPGQQQAGLEVFYADGALTLKHLQETDINSTVTIYDVSGIQLLQEKITNAPSQEFNVSLSKGAYIVKVSGKRDEVRKLLVK